MIILTNLSKSYGMRSLFSGINLNVGPRDRIAVIGPNGSGKTTLFEIIAGHISPDSGNVALSKGSTVGYLKQDILPSSRGRLLDEVASSSEKINGLAHQIEMLQEDLAVTTDAEDSAELLRELGELQHEFEFSGGYYAEQEARVILSGLGFKETDFSRPLTEFSGGWLMRAELGKLLFIRPDVLMLDEPTNHLDLESTAWLESYLKTYRGALLLTSHDRTFLNHVATHVLAIEADEVILYHGNYDEFVEARQEELKLREATVARQETKIKKEMRFIERFRYKATKAAQVQSRIKNLQKMEKVVIPRSTKKIAFSFPVAQRAGNDVMMLRDVFKSYGDKSVYRDLNLTVCRGDRVALVGPNGAGKTTLLKVLAGVLPFESGERVLGHNVSIAYFAQYYVESLNTENSALAELETVAPLEPTQKLRGILGAFLFSGDDVYKKVAVLSGGEKSRLALAKILLQPANFLLMDEPTNHLDIPSREILADALEAYGGTLCFITHDRTLIRQTANKIVEVAGGNIRVFNGNYDEYLERRESGAAAASLVADSGKEPNVKNKLRQRRSVQGNLRNDYYLRITPIKRRIAEIEAESTALTAKLREIESLLADPEHYKDEARIIETTREHRRLREALPRLSAEWDELTTESERITRDFQAAKADMEELEI